MLTNVVGIGLFDGKCGMLKCVSKSLLIPVLRCWNVVLGTSPEHPIFSC